MYAYCLFCETQKCDVIAAVIEKSHGLRCISPRIIQRKWVKGQGQEACHKWLPGYVFAFSEEPVNLRFAADGIIRCLGNGPLEGEDLAFALMIHECNGVMGTIRLAEVGDRCVVSDPAWSGVEGTILKVDRSRKRCCVEFSFDQNRWNVWLGYDLVKRVEDKDERN